MRAISLLLITILACFSLHAHAKELDQLERELREKFKDRIPPKAHQAPPSTVVKPKVGPAPPSTTSGHRHPNHNRHPHQMGPPPPSTTVKPRPHIHRPQPRPHQPYHYNNGCLFGDCLLADEWQRWRIRQDMRRELRAWELERRWLTNQRLARSQRREMFIQMVDDDCRRKNLAYVSQQERNLCFAVADYIMYGTPISDDLLGRY